MEHYLMLTDLYELVIGEEQMTHEPPADATEPVRKTTMEERTKVDEERETG